MTTDQPVYRPGQTVRFKGVIRRQKLSSFWIPDLNEVRIDIRDPKERTLQSQLYRCNEFGSVFGDFRLGDEPVTGMYRVVVRLPKTEAYRTSSEYSQTDSGVWTKPFNVARLTPPDTEVAVQLTSPDPQALKGKVSVQDNSGKPLGRKEVEWSLCDAVQEPQSARIGDAGVDWELPVEDVRFGPYEHIPWWWNQPRWRVEETIASGKGRTNADGLLELEFDVAPSHRVRRYSLKVYVDDGSSQGVVVDGSVIIHPADLHVDVKEPRCIEQTSDTLTRLIRVTTLKGKPVPGREVELALTTVDQSKEKNVQTLKVITHEHGIARASWKRRQHAAYRITARAADNSGRILISHSDSDYHYSYSRPSEADVEELFEGHWKVDNLEPKTFEITTERKVFDSGETAQLKVFCPYAPTTALLCVDSRAGYEVRTVKLQKLHEVIDLPLRSEHTPNVQITMAVWSKGRSIAAGAELLVYPAERMLDVRVSPDRQAYRPGENATISVSTLAGGVPIPSEFELCVGDDSVRALEVDTPPMSSFYLRRHRTPRGYSITCDYSELAMSFGKPPFPVLHGLGGWAPAPTRFSDEQLQTKFVPTLFWNSHLRTDKDGRATIQVKVPDSSTQWRITARAVAKDDRFGSASASFATLKE